MDTARQAGILVGLEQLWERQFEVVSRRDPFLDFDTSRLLSYTYEEFPQAGALIRYRKSQYQTSGDENSFLNEAHANAKENLFTSQIWNNATVKYGAGYHLMASLDGIYRLESLLIQLLFSEESPILRLLKSSDEFFAMVSSHIERLGFQLLREDYDLFPLYGNDEVLHYFDDNEFARFYRGIVLIPSGRLKPSFGSVIQDHYEGVVFPSIQTVLLQLEASAANYLEEHPDALKYKVSQRTLELLGDFLSTQDRFLSRLATSLIYLDIEQLAKCMEDGGLQITSIHLPMGLRIEGTYENGFILTFYTNYAQASCKLNEELKLWDSKNIRTEKSTIAQLSFTMPFTWQETVLRATIPVSSDISFERQTMLELASSQTGANQYVDTSLICGVPNYVAVDAIKRYVDPNISTVSSQLVQSAITDSFYTYMVETDISDGYSILEPKIILKRQLENILWNEAGVLRVSVARGVAHCRLQESPCRILGLFYFNALLYFRFDCNIPVTSIAANDDTDSYTFYITGRNNGSHLLHFSVSDVARMLEDPQYARKKYFEAYPR